MIQWEKYFDRIFCIHYLPYKEKVEKLNKELKRVGILDSPVFQWKNTFDSPFYDNLYMLRHKAPSLGCMKSGLAHYDCMKESLLMGYERILILEDDNIFLNDISKIEEILESTPKDYDILLYDNIYANKDSYENQLKNRKINDYFCYQDDIHMILANCYALSKKGMEHLTTNQERCLMVGDFYTSHINGAIEDPTLKRVFAIKPIAVQNQEFSENSENGRLSKKIKGIHRNGDDYDRIGLDFKEYGE